MRTIREAREALGISQGELAKQMQTTQGAVSQWEKGLTNPGTGKLKRLAAVLHTTVDDLLTDGEETDDGTASECG